MEIDLGQYIRDLIDADLTGTRPRRRRAKYDGIRQKLAEIHATVIGCSNELTQCRARGTGTEHHDRLVAVLQDATVALLLLARSIGPR